MAADLDNLTDVPLTPDTRLEASAFRLAWVDDWYDGPLAGMIERGGERLYLALHDRGVVASDADLAARQIADAEGTVVMGPVDIGEDGRMLLATDATGAAFGVWQPGRHVGARAFYVAGGYKYAMAGEGACFLHVPPSAASLRPRNTGWFAAFEALDEKVAGRVPYSSGAMRFMGATFDPSGLYRLNATMRWLNVPTRPGWIWKR